MQRKQASLVPPDKLDGPPQARHHFTRFDQVNQLVTASEERCCMDHPEGCLIMVFFNTGDNLDAT